MNLYSLKIFLIAFLIIQLKGYTTFLELAFEAHQQGDSQKAEEFYLKAVNEGDNLAIIYFNLGNLYYAQDRLSEAAISYEKTIALYPDFLDAYLNLGRMHYLYGSYNRALEVFNTYHMRDNSDYTLNMLMGDTYRKLRVFPEAEERYRSAARLRPEQDDAHIAIAELYLDLQDYNVAHKEIVAGQQNVDFSKSLLIYEGDLLREQKKYNEAISVYRSILFSKNSTNFNKQEQYEVGLKIVDALLLAGNENYALYELEQLVKKHPTQSTGIHYLDNIYITKEKGDRGYRFFTSFFDRNPTLAKESLKNLLAYAYNDNQLFLVKEIVAFMDQRLLKDELVTAIKNELNL